MSTMGHGGWALLASGFSRRFGADKLLAPLPGRHLTVLEQTLSAYRKTRYPLAVVLRPDQQQHVQYLPEDVAVLANADAAQGMAASIRCAVRWAQAEELEWLGIALADMPWIQPDTLQVLAGHAHRERIARPVYVGPDRTGLASSQGISTARQGLAGHPVLFGQRFFPELARLIGDEGARRLLASLPQDQLDRVPTADCGCFQDVDTPADLTGPPGAAAVLSVRAKRR
ncbi:MAG: nucleotidyltransferase family protein [Gammaproteobacteria bacterium]|nr:MAG: nucleotidyltransferase family protein [Gammaproteobacteria bacterium]